jgi:plastocyanin
MRKKFIGIIIIGSLLIIGACATTNKAPNTAAIKIQIVGTDLIEYWRPSTAVISAGGVVTWLNTGPSQRSVISDQGLFNEILVPGKSFSYTFKDAGTFTFHDDPNIETDTIEVK